MSKICKDIINVCGIEFNGVDDNMVRVECPYCNLIHKHNGHGLKQSHCFPGGFYYIVEIENG